jgi:hypothetical protein
MSGTVPFLNSLGVGDRSSVVFVTSHESERDFGAITLLFSVAPLSDMPLENSRVMLPEFRLDSLLVTNSCFIGRS